MSILPALWACLLTGCTESPPSQKPDVPRAVARFSAIEARPAFLDVPFPSDLYIEDDGTIVDTLPGLEAQVPGQTDAVEAALAGMRGFGRTSGILFRIDGPREVDPDTGEVSAAQIDEESLPRTNEASMEADSSAQIVDLDALPGEPVRVPCRAGYQDDRPAGSLRRPVLVVSPARGFVLKEGHRYAALLTRTLTTAGSRLRVEPSDDFRAIRDGVRRGDPLAARYGEAVDEVVAKAGVAKEAIVALTVFTTQSGSSELLLMRDSIGALAPPVISWDPAEVAPMAAALFTADPAAPGATASLDDWLGSPAKLPDGSDDPAGDQPTGKAHDALAAMATGVFRAPNFLWRSPKGFSDPLHRTFTRGPDGAPVPNPEEPTAKVWVTIALPKAAPPPSGYPVVIVQHGLGGDRLFLLSLANTFAKHGWATAAIEATTFGARADHTNDVVDQKSRFGWSGSAAYGGPDGFVDELAGPLALFGQIVQFGAARDQIRQSAIDVGALTEVLASPELDLGPLAAAAPGAKLDGSRMAYVGDSFGAIVGTLVAASDPRIRAMVLNVGGGGVLTELVSHAPYLAQLLGTAGALTFGLPRDRLGWRHPLANLLQGVLDPADPLFYADKLVRDPVPLLAPAGGVKSVVLIEALWDEIVANEGSEALARAAGMPLAAPHVGPNGGVELDVVEPKNGEIRGVPAAGMTTVLVQASPATHGSDLYNRFGVRHYAFPFGGGGGDAAFRALPSDIPIEQPYLALQSMVVGFFASAFAGEVPVVKGFAAPVRDFDQDGREDATDPDPNDPSR